MNFDFILASDRLKKLAGEKDDQLARDIKLLMQTLESRDKKIVLLVERVRESNGVIKLLYRGKHPNQIAICNGVLDQNTAAISQ